MDSSTPEGRELVELIWNEFRRSGRWISKKQALIHFDNQGKDLQAVLQNAPGVQVVDAGSAEEVHASIEAFVPEIKEVVKLLKPIPEILHLCIDKFVANPPFNEDSDDLRVTFREVKSLWPTEEQARRAIMLLTASRFQPLRFGNSVGSEFDDRFERPGIDCLRYEAAHTLNNVLSIKNNSAPRFRVGRTPKGRPLAVLKAIYAYAQQHKNWPVALPFAVDHRGIGFIPDLIQDLHPRFVRNVFYNTRHSLLPLTPLALPFVDPDGSAQTLLLEIVKVISSLWRTMEDGSGITLDAIAARVKGAPEQLKSLVLFVENEPWGAASVSGHRPNETWTHRPNEKALRLKDLKSWGEYLDIWYPDYGPEESMGFVHNALRPTELVGAVSPTDKTEPSKEVMNATAGLLRKKYQVFISSTFEDLREERAELTWKLLEGHHIPAGMEAFTSTNDRGWATIKDYIDQSDYYVLIVAGRYGQIDQETGKSWTEMEYEYARQAGQPILVFIREDSAITANKSDDDDEKRKKLKAFKDSLRKAHLVTAWRDGVDLASRVAQSITNHINKDERSSRARPGWYRGSLSGGLNSR